MTNAETTHNTLRFAAGTDDRAALHRRWIAAAALVDELGAAIDVLDPNAPQGAHNAAWDRFGDADNSMNRVTWQIAHSGMIASDAEAVAVAEVFLRENRIAHARLDLPEWRDGVLPVPLSSELSEEEVVLIQLGQMLATFVRSQINPNGSTPAASAAA